MNSDSLIVMPIGLMIIISFMGIITDNSVFNGMDLTTISAVVFLFFGGAAIVGAGAAINFLGSGLNASGTMIVFQSLALSSLWAAFSITTGNYLVFSGNEIGQMIYATLTITFVIGVILHIRGSGN